MTDAWLFVVKRLKRPNDVATSLKKTNASDRVAVARLGPEGGGGKRNVYRDNFVGGTGR